MSFSIAVFISAPSYHFYLKFKELLEKQHQTFKADREARHFVDLYFKEMSEMDPSEDKGFYCKSQSKCLLKLIDHSI